MASRLRYSDPSSSDSDGSDDDGRPSLAAAYRAIDVRRGLLGADTYVQAVRELEAILVIYKARDAPKDFKKLLEADIAVAVASPLAAGPTESRALQSLMAAAERALPQAKRQALAQEYKQRQLERARAARRRQSARCVGAADGDSGDEGSDGEAQPLSVALPRECLDAIMAHLDPLSLASAACTCRTWRDAAGADELWAPLLRVTFGSGEAEAAAREAEGESTVAAGGGAPHRRRFCRLAAAHPEWLLPWRSRRVAVHGAVRWVSPQTWGRVLASPGPAGVAWAQGLGVAFLTPGQVTAWLDRREPRYLAGVAAGWRQREAARRRGGGGA